MKEEKREQAGNKRGYREKILSERAASTGSIKDLGKKCNYPEKRKKEREINEVKVGGRLRILEKRLGFCDAGPGTIRQCEAATLYFSACKIIYISTKMAVGLQGLGKRWYNFNGKSR